VFSIAFGGKTEGGGRERSPCPSITPKKKESRIFLSIEREKGRVAREGGKRSFPAEKRRPSTKGE